MTVLTAFLLAAAIDAVFADLSPGSPGCALAVSRDGVIVYERGYGTADLEHGVPITPRTVFDTGSVSKMFTAASVFVLEDQGRLSLDDSIRKHLPELPGIYQAVTLRHLIHHTGGVRDYLFLRSLAGHPELKPVKPREVIDLLARQKGLDFPPGERHSYTNSGYVLLAAVVEKASGQPLSRFAEENLFKPLGMTSTRFFDDPTRIVLNRADSYFPSGVFRTWAGTVGDTGLLSTAGDLSRWDMALAKPGQPGKLRDGTPLGYAGGLFLRDFRGMRTVGHGGSTLGYVSDLLSFPEASLTIACLCNTPAGAPSRRTREVAAIFLGDRLQPEPPVVPADAPAGLYWDREGDSFRKVWMKDGKVVLLRFGAERELAPLGGGRFRIPGTPGTVEVTFGSGFLTETGDAGLMRFERIEPSAPPDPSGYAGTYRSEEVGGDLSFAVREGALVLQLGGQEIPLEPFAQDGFRHEILGTMRFDPEGFVLNTPRAKGLRYLRRDQSL
ncbi:MAG TPA: serine hydrolase domain-containing protein [Thermoanaerobaculia bacterium]|nr:serine hydrolase domain-containing protein [Thermoanaerobaculia bacterium]